MALDRFMVSFNSADGGLQTNVKPWLIADNAFAELNNAYIYRGRLRKRFGSIMMGDTQLESRLRMELAPLKHLVTTPENIAVGQMFSIGDDIFTVNDITAPYPVNLLSTSAVTAQLTAANQVTFSAITDTVYWYPAKPVMGIATIEQSAVHNEISAAFDTTYAYKFDDTSGAWERLETGTDTWTGTNSDFFWASNYDGATPDLNLLWVTNFVAADGIRYWDTATWTKPTLTYAAAGVGGNNEITTARIIVQFKNRLVFLNTVELVNGAPTSFRARCRYSGIGSPLAANAWRQDIPGNGSAIDAPTREAIVTAQFLKDRLIVFFESSTWELVYTGNQVFPFAWQKINTEIGAESTFSQIPFDKVVLGIGNVGIHACNGSNVDRIDDKIPQLVFDFHNQDDGVKRISGTRDYYTEMVYWAFPDSNRSANFPYPNKVLAYNYSNNSWGINDDSFTTFGTYQIGPTTPQITWENATATWETLGAFWGSLDNTVRTRAVIGGNQEGWVLIIRPDVTRNAAALQLTSVAASILTVVDHNLSVGDYILIEDAQGLVLSNSIMRVSEIVDKDNFTVIGTLTGTYLGGGTIARVSRIDIKSKEYNFYADKDRNAYIPRADFLINTTSSGEIAVDYFNSTTPLSAVAEGSVTGALLGTGILETSPYSATLAPLEQTQSRVWHPVYLQAEGECIQLRFYFNDVQMTEGTIALQDFQLHAINFFAQPTSARLQ